MIKKITHIIPSIILYAIAGLIAVYAIWAYSHSADIVSQARAAGQLAASGNGYDIASFYMGSSGQYFIYALLLAAAGLILQRKQQIPSEPAVSVNEPMVEANDNELDDWFEEANGGDIKE
jgi:amino acid transporter